nr:MAG TPA: protein of unknown function (DUF4969) [Caudoviricetes sp.]
MSTGKNWLSLKLAALVMLLTLQACSSSSALQQPSEHKLQPTPLPQEISQITTSDSQPILQMAREWLESLWALSSGETPK